MLQKMFEIHDSFMEKKRLPHKRYLYDEINWDLNAVCIFGARGTGKTTLIIQHCNEKYGSSREALYIPADHIFVSSTGLYEIADTFFKNGGLALYIDEVHKYSNWTIELKNIIDVYPEKKVVVSGSSTIELRKSKGDLSRRVVYYELKGLSFREFLNVTKGTEYKAVKLNEIINDHNELSLHLRSENVILKEFKDYIEYGYYPFFLEGKDEYFFRLGNVIEKVVFEDIIASFNVSQPKLPALKKLLWIIATSDPFTPNVDRISKELKISREYVYNYLEYLEKAGFIITARKAGSGFRSARKPEKIFMQNTSLIKTLSERTYQNSAGTMRETFFANQVSGRHEITIPEKGDFEVDGLIFEVGGKNKKSRQLEGLKNAFYALDEIESGFKTVIPLYLFGFLY